VPSFPLVEELLELGLSGSSGGMLDLGRAKRALKVYDRLMVGGAPDEPESLESVELGFGSRLVIAEWGVAVEVDELPVAELLSREPGVLHVDRDRLRLPLVMRRPKPGDRIAPIGLGGHHKTLSRYFKDAKVPLPDRAGALVLADRDRLIWVVGRVVSEECKITPFTQSVLRVRMGKPPPAP
jgi:tRNA(Ile)-lysidine synthase